MATGQICVKLDASSRWLLEYCWKQGKRVKDTWNQTPPPLAPVPLDQVGYSMPDSESEPSGFLQLHVQIASPGGKVFDAALIRPLHAGCVLGERQSISPKPGWNQKRKKHRSRPVQEEGWRVHIVSSLLLHQHFLKATGKKGKTCSDFYC